MKRSSFVTVLGSTAHINVIADLTPRRLGCNVHFLCPSLLAHAKTFGMVQRERVEIL